MRNLEFVYKIDEFKFKEQIALSFQNWGLFVCLLQNTPKLPGKSQLWVSTANDQMKNASRGKENQQWIIWLSLWFISLHEESHFFLCWEKSGGYTLHRLQKINCCSPNCVYGSQVSLQSPGCLLSIAN